MKGLLQTRELYVSFFKGNLDDESDDETPRESQASTSRHLIESTELD